MPQQQQEIRERHRALVAPCGRRLALRTSIACVFHRRAQPPTEDGLDEAVEGEGAGHDEDFDWEQEWVEECGEFEDESSDEERGVVLVVPCVVVPVTSQHIGVPDAIAAKPAEP